ncbi:MAG TPA: hypothetical protein VJU15_09230 [Gemmatimonadales bacterium]|nr:hypothetical protein [Gemmatimonadales bacterium]
MLSWRLAGTAGLVVTMAGCRSDPIEPSPPKPVEEAVAKQAQLIAPIKGGSDFLRQQVIRFFAPVIYQDIEDHSEADLFTRVTFDGEWKGTNNWGNTFKYPKRAYVYTSLIEDSKRYFLHYGLYWPRDWCGGTCTVGQDFHENDMEGLSLVVDKRLTASGWPYGQVVTMDARSHNGIERSRNCSLTGYAPYVVLRSGGTPPCFVLKTGFNSTLPSPPSRVAVYANSQSHATRAFKASDYPFAGGDGVVYFPTDRVAEVPASTATTTQTAYTVQWMDSTETQNYSLWSQRRNPIMAGPASIFEYDYAGNVGPHDVYYLKFFACGQPYCPSLFQTRAKAPWGIQASSAERLGEWHNHPAWSWSRTYGPLNGSSPYYEYTCQTESCRKNNTYIHNIYWDDTPWTSGGVSGPGGPTCSGCPKTSAGAPVVASVPHGSERRWDFDGAREVEVSGDVIASAVTQPDEEWGYSGGKVRALRVEGRGEARIVFRGPIATGKYTQIVARVRRAHGRAATLTAEWSGPGQANRGGGALIRDVVASKSWEIVTLPLTDLPAWNQLGSVDRMTLTVRLDGGQGDALDLDFVVLAP